MFLPKISSLKLYKLNHGLLHSLAQRYALLVGIYYDKFRPISRKVPRLLMSLQIKDKDLFQQGVAKCAALALPTKEPWLFSNISPYM